MGLFDRVIPRFLRRPDVNEQTTGHLAYQQYQSYAFAGFNGNGGQLTTRTMAAAEPATIVPGNSLKPNDPSVTGNLNTNIVLQPLGDNNGVLSGLQF